MKLISFLHVCVRGFGKQPEGRGQTWLNPKKIYCYHQFIVEGLAGQRIQSVKKNCNIWKRLLNETLTEIWECSVHLHQLFCLSSALSVRGGWLYQVYLSDLLSRSFVRLQLIQDRLGVLQHHIHLLPHLSLCFCGLGIWKGQKQQQQQQQGQWDKSDWCLIHIYKPLNTALKKSIKSPEFIKQLRNYVNESSSEIISSPPVLPINTPLLPNREEGKGAR